MADSWSAFLWAIGQQESGGNYKDVNSSSGALGKYQVMPSNLPDWSRQALGHSVSADEFLNSPQEQEAVATKILGGYYQQYGAAGAAAEWYSGQPDPTKTYGSPSVADYVKEVLGRMSGAPAGGATLPTSDPTGSGGGGATVPVGWHIPGTPWDIPTPGDAIGGIEGAAAGIGRTLTRVAVMAPVVLVGGALVVIGFSRMTGLDGASLMKGMQ